MSDRGDPFCKKGAPANPLQKLFIIANTFICKQTSHLGKGVAAPRQMVQISRLPISRQERKIIRVFGVGSGEGLFAKSPSPVPPQNLFRF